MKYNLIVLLLILGVSHSAFGQLTEIRLQEAVTNGECHEIADALDDAQLNSDQMKFSAGVCYYRNGHLDKALPLFAELNAGQGPQWKMASFWEAKIHARLGNDSLALSLLEGIPGEFLSFGMLNLPEFKHLMSTSSEFNKLRNASKPKLNIWTGLLSVIAGIGFLIGVLFLLGRSKFSKGEKWLALMVLSMALILVSYLTIWTGFRYYFPYLQNVWPFLTLLIGPSIFFYLKETFKEDYDRREVFYHLIIPFCALLFLMPAILRNFGIAHNLPPDLVRIGSSSILLTAHILFYTVRVHFLTKNEWQVDANIKAWTKILSMGMNIYAFSFLSYFVLVSCSFFNPQWDYSISLVMGIGILIIAYMGLVQKRVFQSEPLGDILSVKKYSSSNLTPSVSERIKIRLEKLLHEEKVFKENELRLDDLASYLDISRHQLSQVINEHYKVNFFEFINRHRIAYVEKVLANPDYAHYTIIQIAYEAGFNNKASFNTYFKREVGMTPSAYRIKVSNVVTDH